MPRRIPIPPQLAAGPFTVADARDAHIGEGRLRGADLERPFRGVRSPVRGAPPDPDERFVARCRQFAPLLRPGQFFSHLTAARLWSCPLSVPGGESLHVSTEAPHRPPRRVGIVGHLAKAGSTRVVLRHGFPVSDPVSTWLALSSVATLDELVVAADSLILDPFVLDPLDIRPFATLDELRRALAAFSGRGARTATTAIELSRQGAESRPETLLRLLLWRAGLPKPMVNADVTDAAGRWLGRGDLVFAPWRTVVEYDGHEHRTDSRTYDKDITRIENFVNAEWRVVRVRKAGLFGRPQDTVDRVVRALRAGGWTP
jgi:hypothetical protein